MTDIVLTLDVMDVAGEHQSHVTHSIYKVQLAPDGTEIKREKTASKSRSSPGSALYWKAAKLKG